MADKPALRTNGMGAGTAFVVANALAKLDQIVGLLDRIARSLEQEPELDVTFTAGGSPSAASVVPISIPRTWHHVELTLSVTAAQEVALFAGNVTLTQAAQQHGHNSGVTGQSSAIVASGGGAVTVREYLDQSGILTVYFAAAAPGAVYANVRVRVLDKSQANPKRT